MPKNIKIGSVRFKYDGVTSYHMRRYGPYNGLMVSLWTYHSECAGAHGKMNGAESLCTCLGHKSGV